MVPNLSPNPDIAEIIKALGDIIRSIRELEREMLLIRNAMDLESFGE